MTTEQPGRISVITRRARWPTGGKSGMARPLRMESEAGVYHMLNRGNARTDIFRSDQAKAR